MLLRIRRLRPAIDWSPKIFGRKKSSTATSAKACSPRFWLQHSLRATPRRRPDVMDKNRDLNPRTHTNEYEFVNQVRDDSCDSCLQGRFSSQIFWKAGSPRNGSHNGSRLRRDCVIHRSY